MNEKFKETRLYMCLGIVIAGFLPWLELISKSETSGEISASSKSSMVLSGYQAVQYSFMGILIFLIPILLVAIEFVQQEKIEKKNAYLLGSGFGIVILIISFIICKGAVVKAKASSSVAGVDMDIKTEVNIKLGFWLIIICYIAILTVTLIKDFVINKETISKEGLKNVITGVASDIGGKVSTIASENNMLANMATNTCPKCGASVIKGKKFCAKCGEKMPEAEENGISIKLPTKGTKSNKMITVNEYINSMKLLNCDKCGESVPNGNKFCPNCGEKVVIKIVMDKCLSCGGDILKDKNYCPDCGNKIEAVELKITCKKCNAELLYGKKYCVECGTKVE